MLSVIALDRFADYVGDEAVAPVRETCAQTVGIMSAVLRSQGLLGQLCRVVNAFIDERRDTCWEMRHSGIMLLKYTIGACSAELRAASSSSTSTSQLSNLRLVFAHTFDNILVCIRDEDDDVRQVASASLEPVSTYLSRLLSGAQLESLVRILVEFFSSIDDLSISCATIMSLLADLLAVASASATHTQTQTAQTDTSDANNNNNNTVKVIFMRLLNNQSIIPRLLPFMQHANMAVRRTTLDTIHKILLAMNDDNNGVSSS